MVDVSQIGARLRLAVHSKLVDMGLSKWAVEDCLKDESFPQKEGEWGFLEPRLSYPVGTAHYGVPPLGGPLGELSFTYKRYKDGAVIEDRILSYEDLEEVRARLRSEPAADEKDKVQS